MSLATYSGDLKVYKSEEDYALAASVTLSNEKQSFGRITWSGDGKWLAAAPVHNGGGPLPVIKYKGNQLTPFKYVTLSNIRSASFFNWTNKNIAVGNDCGEVFIWDLKEKRVAAQVDSKRKRSVDHLSVNSDDTYIASGSASSEEICLHGLKTNKVVNKFSIPNSVHTSSLYFCMCKKNYLAASSYESTVCVWDINKSEPIFTNLNSHVGSCTDIAFSPINFSVIASVSLTQTLKLFDIRQKIPILDLSMGKSMTCVDMISRGDTIAAGTPLGSVIIFDLRANKVLNSFQVQTEGILSVKVDAVKTPEHYKEVEMNSIQILESSERFLEISAIDILSPINTLCKTNICQKSRCHSTPKVDDATLPYDDSVLRVFSNVSSKNVGFSSPFTGAEFDIKEETFTDVKPDYELKFCDDINTNDAPNNECMNDEAAGDVLPVDISQTLKDIVSELRNLKTEVKTMKEDSAKKYEMLNDLLCSKVKSEIFSGNCQSKLEHIGLKWMLNDLNELNENRHQKLLEECYLNSLRFSVIKNMIEQLHNK